MTDQTDIVKTGKVLLKGQDAIDLWLKREVALNQWVAENPVADVDFSECDFSKYEKVSFADFKLPKGYVNFRGVTFGDGEVSFFNTSFGDGDVSFAYASIGDGHVSFINTNFGLGLTSL